jgi:hypothetical protein
MMTKEQSEEVKAFFAMLMEQMEARLTRLEQAARP